MSAIESFLGAIVVVLLVGIVLAIFAGNAEAQLVMSHACGECDHVGECGDYECRPGVDGWQLKAGAR